MQSPANDISVPEARVSQTVEKDARKARNTPMMQPRLAFRAGDVLDGGLPSSEALEMRPARSLKHVSAMVRREIRPMKTGDLVALSHLHGRAFPGFFLSSLGPPVLCEYYRTVLDYPGSCALVAIDCGLICGFVVGFAEPAVFYRHLRRRALRFLPPLFRAVLRNPSTVVPMAQRVTSLLGHRPGPVPPESDDPVQTAVGSWELASLAVDPQVQGQGYGSQLVTSFIRQAMVHSATRIVLRTDALENDRVNLFYERLGFERRNSCHTAGSRLMNMYEFRVGKAA
jgi:ribosomal protein S18 acetylase RimI-like enzyme